VSDSLYFLGSWNASALNGEASEALRPLSMPTAPKSDVIGHDPIQKNAKRWSENCRPLSMSSPTLADGSGARRPASYPVGTSVVVIAATQKFKTLRLFWSVL
jgi:hypothetical protein